MPSDCCARAGKQIINSGIVRAANLHHFPIFLSSDLSCSRFDLARGSRAEAPFRFRVSGITDGDSRLVPFFVAAELSNRAAPVPARSVRLVSCRHNSYKEVRQLSKSLDGPRIPGARSFRACGTCHPGQRPRDRRRPTLRPSRRRKRANGLVMVKPPHLLGGKNAQ